MERRVNECIQGFICLGLLPPPRPFIGALVITGSYASAKNMQKNLYLKLYVENKHIFPEEKKETWGSEK